MHATYCTCKPFYSIEVLTNITPLDDINRSRRAPSQLRHPTVL